MTEVIVYPQQNQGQAKTYIKWVFYGIIIFLAVIFPFFGHEIRSQLGTIFRGLFNTVFNIIGMLCIFGGIIYILLGIFGLFSRRFSFKQIILGALLLWVGCWMTGIVFNFFGVDFGSSSGSSGPITSSGYH